MYINVKIYILDHSISFALNFTKQTLVDTAKGGLPDFFEYPTNLRSYRTYRPGILLVETNGGTHYARLSVSVTANSADIEIAKARPTQIVTQSILLAI